MKADARNGLQSYVKGYTDGGDSYWKNYYSGMVYNRSWHTARAKSLDDWSKKYGGNIHLMCVEFGCYDSEYSTVRFGSVGNGTSAATRLIFLTDLRESFEEYGIGWSYWSYNEGFTVFNTTYHIQYVGGSPGTEKAVSLADYDLFIGALGLTPKIRLEQGLESASGAWSLTSSVTSAMPGFVGGTYYGVSFTQDNARGTVPVFGNGYAIINNPNFVPEKEFTISAEIKASGSGTVLASGEQFLKSESGEYNRLSIQDFDSLHNVWGSQIAIDSGAFSVSASSASDLIICWKLPHLDHSAYLLPGKNGAIRISVYLSDASKVTGGQLEFTSDTNSNDKNEIAWDLTKMHLKNGWNELTLTTENMRSNTTDIKNLNSARFYLNVSGAVTVKLDSLYACNTAPYSSGDYWKLYVDSSGCLAFSANGLSGLTGSGVKIADGSWHRVVVSLKNGRFRYYIDGKERKALSVSGSLTSTSSADLIIGSHFLSGSVSRAAVYPRALLPTEIWQ